MSQPDLPLEIVETIIDLLRNEPEALRQCSQASKLFALLTRKYTFGDIELLSPLDLRKWEETFPEPANSPACYTRSLTVGLIEVGTTEDVDKGCWIRSFTKVRRLFVRSERCWEFGPNGSYPPFDALSSVTSLKLHSTHLRPQQNFELICSFPLLEDLDIEHCEKSFGEIDGCRDSIQRLGRPKLTGTLFLRDLDLRHTIDLLLALPGGLHFRKIALDRYIPEQFRELAALMEKCYGTLECIDIGGRLISAPPIENPRTPSGLDFSQATKLKEVAFRFIAPLPLWIAAVLETVPPEHEALQQISIYCDQFSAVSADGTEAMCSTEEEWAVLDCFLDRLCQSRGCRVSFVYAGPWDIERCKSLTKNLLPKMKNRGLLDVTPS